MSSAGNDAHKLFRIERDGAQAVQKIICTGCGREDRNVLNGKCAASDETLVSFFRRRGWQIKKHTFLCANCVNKAHDAARVEKAKRMTENKLSVVQTEPSSNSVLAKKIMSDLLFENYDTVKRDYKLGWDDSKIAKECGLSESFVAQRRLADYGPVSPPRSAVVRECIDIAENIMIEAKEYGHFAKHIENRSIVLLGELEKLSSVLKKLS